MDDQPDNQASNAGNSLSMERLKTKEYLEPAVRIGALFLVIYWVSLIVAPFIPAILWAIIIAVAAGTCVSPSPINIHEAVPRGVHLILPSITPASTITRR